MTRKLAWIAMGGLFVGIACLVLAYFAGGRSGGFVPALTGRPCDMHADSAVTERHLAWPGGDTIEIAVPATVRYRRGSGSDVVVRGAGHFVERVALRGHTIVLACHPIGSPPEIEITLPGEAFDRINLSGSVRLFMESLDQPALAVNIAGSGSVQMQGRLEQLSLSVAGSGWARVADLDLQRLIVKLSGSGHVEASPREDAKIEIAGSADVRLLIRPKSLQSRIAGSGRVSQPPPDSAEKK
ncbi:MAG: DUF2807 domain-containing protein [Alphaproteobacteria bacterium]|nr:DUF2807 domain-containing protein [Alphaproteobacteria bacterium]